MGIKKIIGIVLIVAGLLLGYMSGQKISENSSSVEVFDLKVDMSDKSEVNQGYIYLGLAVLLFGGGIYMLKNK